jgi:nucleotide-binding universal stress UspA family protein
VPVSVRRVIVGVKDVALSGAAVGWAAMAAAVEGRRLVVVHATATIRSGGDRVLAQAVAAAQGGLAADRIQPVMRPGSAGAVLTGLAYAEDVLVIGAPAHTGWLHARSVTRYLLERSPCPVVVVRSTAPGGGPAAGGGGSGGPVVVGVDGSGAGRAALAFGFEFAVRRRLPVVAVHVSAKSGAAVESAGQQLLAEQVGPFEHLQPGLAVHRLVRSGPVAAMLLAAVPGAALLVTGVSGNRLGTSVVRGLIDGAGCPVAVIRAR